MMADLITRLTIGERLAQSRRDEIAKVHALVRAARAYEEALVTGAMPRDCPEWSEYLEADYRLNECDQVWDLARDAAEPEADLFGYDARSLQSLVASASFDAGMGK